MSRIRFLADQNLNEDIVAGLLRHDTAIQIVRTRDVGLTEAADPDLLAYAAQERLIVISHDLRSMPAHAYARVREGLAMPGLFMVRQTDPIGPPIESLFLVWSASDAEEWSGQVIYLPL